MSAPRGRGSWRDALLNYIQNPADPAVYYHDSEVIVVEDKFPKAQMHYLVLPTAIIRKFSELNESHVPLIETMFAHAKRIAKEFVVLIFYFCASFDCEIG